MNILEFLSIIKNKILSLLKNIHNLDNDSQIIIYCVILLLISFIYFVYIISFIITPFIFDAIKDYLPIKVNMYLTKYINRKINTSFIIICSLFVIFSLLFVILILISTVILNN